jgi:tetratricopeptide (TPR) repeat protein
MGFCCAGAEWVAVRGDGYEIITDTGANTARSMAVRLEALRELLGGVKKVLPLRVVLTANGGLYRSLRPSASAAGFYQWTPQEDWVVAGWSGAESERILSHELVHAFLEHSGARRPLWLEEGLAEFYSTARAERNGWIIGAPIPSHEAAIRGAERSLFAEDDESKAHKGHFYAQSWAVVHYLLTNPGVRDKSPRFFSLLADGWTIDAASREALRFDSAALLRMAVSTRRDTVFVGPLRTRVEAPPAAPLDDPEGMLVSLALACGKPAVAAKLAKTPAQRGFLALADGKNDEAIRLFDAAIAGGTANGAVYFERAMLTNDLALLEEAVKRTPLHAEARFALALRVNDRARKIELLQEAVRIRPRNASMWHALALELERSGRLPEAAKAALQCRLSARHQTDREMAAGIARLLTIRDTPAASSKPAVTVPPSWQGLRGDATAEGTLVNFDCAASPPVLSIAFNRGTLTLIAAKPSQIRITGGTGIQHEFQCGAQQAPVRVEYKKETNELTAIEFR